MIREILMSVLVFALVAIVLALIAARNKFIPPPVKSVVIDETKVIESHNSSVVGRLQPVWRHVVGWLEVYWWLPLSIVAVYAAAKLVLFFSGRESIEDPNALAGIALKLPALICAVIVASVTHQQTSDWLTKEEAKLNVLLAAVHEAKIVALVGLALYFLAH